MLSIDIAQRFGDFLLQPRLQLPSDGVSAVFGPSGCGKTLLLRCVAGLERPAGSRIAWRDDVWLGDGRFVPPARRGIGYVPQQGVLFPHLDVRGNLDYGLQRCRDRRLAFDDVVALLGIAPLLARRVDTLSGGQRQRVAIGRALLASPALLLLDEPLSALDHLARRGLLIDLRRLQQSLQMPMLLVTHAADEVERLADRVAFMREGRIESLQSIADVAADPASPLFVDDGPVALFDAGVHGWESDLQLLELEVAGMRLHVPAPAAPNGPVRLRIAARDVALALTPPIDSSFQNVLPVVVSAVLPGRAGCVLVECAGAGGLRLHAELTRRSADALQLVAGMRVQALVKAAALLD